MAFDVITPAKLGQGAIGATVSTFYTVPANTRTFVKNIDICNTTTGNINVTVYLVPSGDSAADANSLLSSIRVIGTAAQGGLVQWEGSQILNEGDTIQAVGGVVGLTINISGGEAT